MPGKIFWSTEAQRRKYHSLPCAKCGKSIWTSSIKGKQYICISCRREMGAVVNGREGSYTTLAPITRQVISFGTCCKCHRAEQPLANGACPDCRFYDMTDVNPDKSDNARRSKGGHFDYVRRNKK